MKLHGPPANVLGDHDPGESTLPFPESPADVEKSTRQAIVSLHTHTHGVRCLLEELVGLVRETVTPPQISQVTLTAAAPSVLDDSHRNVQSASLGIFNPTAVPVVVAWDGRRATRQGLGQVVPATSLVVLPVAAADVEIGVDPADAAPLVDGDVVITLFRYRTVQAAYLSQLP
jgi:hypothetical protein